MTRRRKHRARTELACLKASTAPAFSSDNAVPEWMPTGWLEKQVAQARREMGEARWAGLNREWE